MLAKHYRLREREVKKVLAKGKPFFSHSLVFNCFPNRLPHSRHAIVISKKSVPNAVVRNEYRRTFYAIAAEYCDMSLGDIVCVVKSKTRLTKDPECMRQFRHELFSLYTKILGKNT